MTFARINGVTHHYQRAGADAGLPVVFVNSLGTDFRIWRAVAEAIGRDHPVLLYDKRGHGLSGVGETPYSMAMLARDLAALMQAVGFGDAVICGVSIGGMIAQQLHADRPDLVRALMLSDTLAKIGDDAMWNKRIADIEAGGLAAIAGGVMERWFSPAFRQSGAEFDGYRTMFLRQPVDGYIATCVALREADLSAHLARIDVPTVCVAGEHDGSTPPDKVAAFAKRIPGARFERIADCGHLPSIEQPARVIAMLADLLARVVMEGGRHGSA